MWARCAFVVVVGGDVDVVAVVDVSKFLKLERFESIVWANEDCLRNFVVVGCVVATTLFETTMTNVFIKCKCLSQQC